MFFLAIERILTHVRPRWLYTRGKTAEARQILARFHSSTGDINSPLVALEIEEIEDRLALDGADSVFHCPVHIAVGIHYSP